jgi:hypothetical protein
VTYLTAREVVRGRSAELFDPEGMVTRAEFITMLMRMLNFEFPYLTISEDWKDQEDIPAFATAPALQAKILGITKGDGQGNFLPQSPVTREEMFTMTYRALKIIGLAPGYIVEPPPYPDWKQMSSFAREPILALTVLGLIRGGSDGLLLPKNSSTRAESAQLLYNLLQLDARTE